MKLEIKNGEVQNIQIYGNLKHASEQPIRRNQKGNYKKYIKTNKNGSRRH